MDLAHIDTARAARAVTRPPFDEPALDEVLADPLARLIWRRDGLTAHDVAAILTREQARLAAGADAG